MNTNKTITDSIIGTGALSTPFWLESFQYGMTVFMLVGGAVLLVLRIALAWREWRKKE